MSLTSGTVIKNPAIDNLIKFSLESEDKYLRLEWIPYEEITNIEPTQINNVYYAIRKYSPYGKVKETPITLVFIGNNEECTPTLVSEFARIYSLPTHKHNNVNDNFKRYFKWLTSRNTLIKGFTKSNDNNYYMVAGKRFYHCYSLYEFCTACGILRCSPVWCICSHKELSNGWTSNNKRLDEFIKKTQLQTNSANHAYLEWIPFDCTDGRGRYLYDLPVHCSVKLIPLEITDETHDLYYAELCDKHPEILTTDVWITIGFTYDTSKQKYCLIQPRSEDGLCLACTGSFVYKINLFCYLCKAPRPLNRTTGDKSLDSFIMESWKNTSNANDAYIQWIEYSLLTNVQEMTSLRHGCTHMADWITDELTRVALKKIVVKGDDFHQLTEKYPDILTPENIWIIGITQDPSTREYYLVFYYDMHTLLERFMRNNKHIKNMQYSDFDELEEIGSGGYGSVYSAKYRKYTEVKRMKETVVLKRFKSFDEIPELFISEFRNHAKCRKGFLDIYGVTQDPETKEYMIVMQYANNGSLLSYVVQNINKLTWKDKLRHLYYIAYDLGNIHSAGLVHCDLHGGNIVLNNINIPLICDLGLSRSVNSRESTIRGVLPFIAPEVFHTRKFTEKSDIYSFGIIMYLVATGEPPFRNRQFDRNLICDIMDGLRPSMPDSAPEEYKKLAERCCDADPDKRPDAKRLYKDPDALTLYMDINNLLIKIRRGNSDDNTWNTIYHTDVKPLSRLEKESKYSSTLFPTGGLPKPRNYSHQLPPLSDFSLPSLEVELGSVDEE